jgi:hypothetical protein
MRTLRCAAYDAPSRFYGRGDAGRYVASQKMAATYAFFRRPSKSG